MKILFLFLLIFSPILWIKFFLYKNKTYKINFKSTFFVFIFGFISCGFCFLFYNFIDYLGFPPYFVVLYNNLLLFLLYCIFIVGAIEEGFKLLSCFLCKLFNKNIVYNKINIITFSCIIGVGFASFENIIYFQEFDPLTLLARLFCSSFIHAMFCSIWGYYLFDSKNYKKFISFFISAICHGLYDYFVIIHLNILSAIIILLMYLWFYKNGKINEK